MFQSCFAAIQRCTAPEAAAFCLERLADVQNGMNHIHDVWRWAGTFLAFSVVTKNSLTLMKAIWCYGNLFAAAGDDLVALTLIQIALEGLTFMDVHRWKAKCMIDIGNILERRGELDESNLEAALQTQELPIPEYNFHKLHGEILEVPLSSSDATI
jgi:hypothetical protein